MSEKFYDEGLAFKCQQCSHCCRHEPGFVYLSRSDLDRILAIIELSQQDFIEKYCRYVPYYDGSEVLCLKEKPGYDCIFWDNGCKIYRARPVQCSTYPFWTFLMKSRHAWDEESGECPGINKGQIHSKEEIENSLYEYESNIPLRKDEII